MNIFDVGLCFVYVVSWYVVLLMVKCCSGLIVFMLLFGVSCYMYGVVYGV